MIKASNYGKPTTYMGKKTKKHQITGSFDTCATCRIPRYNKRSYDIKIQKLRVRVSPLLSRANFTLTPNTLAINDLFLK